MRIADNFEMNAITYANQGNSFIGIRRSGKTYGASKVAEELLKEGIPIVVFDPTGVWRYLRHGNPGFEILIVGGKGADIPYPDEVTGDFIRSIMSACIKNGASVIFDLNDRHTGTKASWSRVVLAAVEVLMAENLDSGTVRHIFLEEAAEFIPQRPTDGVLYARLESMARLGRNFGLGYTLMNQRSEEIAKAVFEICEQIFVFRQQGKNSLKSIQDWLDKRGLENGKKITAELPKMPSGTCWVINDNLEKKIQIAEKHTFHPDPEKNKITPTVSREVNMKELISAINEHVFTMNVVKEKPVSKKELHDSDKVKQQLQQVIFERDALRVESLRLFEENKQLRSVFAQVKGAVDAVQLVERIAPKDLKDVTVLDIPGEPKTSGNGVDSHITNGERMGQAFVKKAKTSGNAGQRMLEAIALFPGTTKNRMCFIAGLNPKGSTVRAGLAWMRAEGLITEGDNSFNLTAAGKRQAGTPEPPGDLVEYWRSIIGPGNGAGKALLQLNKLYPNHVTRNQLAGMINTQAGSSTFRAVMAILRKNDLVEESGNNITLSSELKL